MRRNATLVAAIAALLSHKFNAESKPLTACAAGRDGDCGHAQCPQISDNEPAATGRHCPLDIEANED